MVDENNLRLEFKATSRFAEYTIKEPERIRAIEQSNSTALVDNQYVAKIYRQLESGINPEIEIGCYLTEVAALRQYAGAARQRRAGRGRQPQRGRRVARLCREPGRRLGRDHGLSRPLYRRAAVGAGGRAAPRDPGAGALSALHGADRPAARRAACGARRRKARRSRAGADRPAHVKRWTSDLKARAERVFERLADSRDGLREADRPLIDQLVAVRATLPDHLNALLPSDIGGLNIRHHGDFRLGQTLIVKDDIFIIDFDGDPRLAAGRQAAQGCLPHATSPA